MKIINEQEHRTALLQWEMLWAKVRFADPHSAHPLAPELQALGETIHEYELTLPEVQELLKGEAE